MYISKELSFHIVWPWSGPRQAGRTASGSQPGRHGNGKVHMSICTLIGGGVLNVAIFGGSLLLPSGTLDLWRAWVLLGVVFVGTVASTVSVFHVNQGLLEERFKPPVQQG
jgi:hypothetical protein